MRRAFQVAAVKPGRPASVALGTSGRAGRRLAEATSRGRTVPARICEMTPSKVSNTAAIRPATRSCMAGAAPR